ncbi:MAG: hypothetical protein M3Y08_13105, partial [Fibrobacterota bacterium]|nr:hypothetical protein [Fibrobacterota bacterium]
HNSDWINSYIDTHMLPDAIAAGIDTVIMAPGGSPSTIANEIQTVKNAGYTIHYTALMNEPDKREGWDKAGNLSKFLDLHNQLASRGLATKQICCDDANVDDDAKERIDGILNDSDAKNYLAALSTHSYSMAGESDYAQRAFDSGKDWWMTEHCTEGTSNPTDYDKASVSSNTMLNDLNQGVTHWIYFIGYGLSEVSLPNVHSNVFLAYYDQSSFGKPVGSNWFVFGAQYHYFRQINQTFPFGTQFRMTTSIGLPSTDMVWTYGTRSPINIAVGKRPDGRWGIAISNASVDSPAGSWNEDYTVHLDITELHGSGSKPFKAMRSGPTSGFESAQDDIVLVDGKATVQVNKSELLTLYTNSGTVSSHPQSVKSKHSGNRFRLVVDGNQIRVFRNATSNKITLQGRKGDNLMEAVSR